MASRVLRPPGGADRWQWGGAEAGAGGRGSSLEFGAKGEQEEVQGLTLVVSNPESMAGVHAGARGVDPGGPGTGRQEPEQSPMGGTSLAAAGRWEQEADERQGRSHTCPRPETRPRARGAHTGHAPVGHSVPFIPSASRAHGPHGAAALRPSPAGRLGYLFFGVFSFLTSSENSGEETGFCRRPSLCPRAPWPAGVCPLSEQGPLSPGRPTHPGLTMEVSVGTSTFP